ncbi:MAG TPA: hypothetical protein VNO32_66010 [Candidatus Acidoferrum sp.]|nr:hypothetical protein [Candidatus Acidoferrum sp.]
MSFTATSTCFYCSNYINRGTQTYIYAEIRHHYKHGGMRDSDRNFHLSCFDKFQDQDGRPFNPHTHYEVLYSETIRPQSSNDETQLTETVGVPPDESEVTRKFGRMSGGFRSSNFLSWYSCIGLHNGGNAFVIRPVFRREGDSPLALYPAHS